MTTAKRSGCPVSMTLDILGDKWTLLILRDLIFEDKRTYGGFLASEEGIATNILASRLRRLTEAGLVEPRPLRDGRQGTGYELTRMGIDLLPVLVEIQLWADKHLPLSGDVRARLDPVRRDKAGFVRDLSERLGQRAAA